MSAGFTPGPWLQGTGGGGGATTYVYETGEDGKQASAIAGCTHEFVERPMEERIANARLIAAAPDMYEALETMVLMTSVLPNTAVHRAVAEAALAKARGEQ